MTKALAISTRSDETDPHIVLVMKAPTTSQILIVNENDSEADQLKTVVCEAGLASESVSTITAACERARSGGFGMILSSSCLEDGSWGRLIDLAHHFELNFEVILLARTISDKE